MTTRILFALLILSSLWACGGDSVTTPEQPTYERGLHEVGTMTRPRYMHAATQLQSGKVLIAGGNAALPPAGEGVWEIDGLVSAEIFDPETGISTPTGDLTASREEDHGILLLPDGRVLITTGFGSLSIEIYDPQSGRFDDVAILPWKVRTQTATLLPSGEVFLTSYFQAGVFDPSKGAFSATFRMYPTRVGHTATLLKDGRVLIVGGKLFGGEWLLGQNLIYDPSTEAFSEAGNLQFDRVHHKAVLLQDGRVLIAGGSTDPGAPVLTAEIYDPETDTFSAAGTSAMNPRAALLLPSGKVFFIHSDNGNISIYNPDTRVFSPPTGYSIGPWRYGATVTPLEDGRVVIAGGLKWSDDSHFWESITDQIFIFTP
ncbi:MAG: kelch repeat-containing protein [Gemmatimonadetes bacterium]|nr:kelch repeat-containing protein [Gemmatimonadota bacterium]